MPTNRLRPLGVRQTGLARWPLLMAKQRSTAVAAASRARPENQQQPSLPAWTQRVMASDSFASPSALVTRLPRTSQTMANLVRA